MENNKRPINPAIMYLSRLLREETRNAFHEEGMFFGQHLFMMFVSQNAGATASDIAKACDLSLASVSVSVNRLVKAGFLRKESDEKDSRVSHLYITQKGEEVKSQICASIDSLEEKITKGFTEDEKKVFTQLLERMIENLDGATFSERILRLSEKEEIR